MTILLLATTLVACSRPMPGNGPLVPLPPNERPSALLAYAPPQRVDNYLLVLRGSTSVDYRLERALACGGGAVVPSLRMRLANEKDEKLQLRLIQVLETMAELGSFDVRSDSETMTVAEHVATSMSDRFSAYMARQALEVIRAGPLRTQVPSPSDPCLPQTADGP